MLSRKLLPLSDSILLQVRRRVLTISSLSTPSSPSADILSRQHLRDRHYDCSTHQMH